MKKSVTTILIIAILLIVAGVVLTILSNQEQEKTLAEVIEIVTNEYDKDFYPAVDEATEYEIDVYTSLLLEKYNDNNVNTYKADVQELKGYETLIAKVISSSKNLRKYCIEKKYDGEEIKSKCSAYVVNYEQSINKFVKDVESFNNKIDDYNETIDDKNKLANYKTLYNLIDINNDGVFEKP